MVRWEDLDFYGSDGMDRIKARAEAVCENGIYTVRLPEKTTYAILRFPRES